jgi:hypothetical protein
MLNCRCDTGAAGTRLRRRGLGELVILLLAIGVMDTGGASPKAALRQQQMQFGQGGDRRAWSAKVHAGARGCVEHPGGHDDNDARTHLNVNDLARRSLLAVPTSHTTAVQRVPAVEDFDLLPDMGRMTS